MSWLDLLPELQGEIRDRLGPLTTRMLRLTCTREYRVCAKGLEMAGLADIFSRAAEQGYLAICKWAYEVGTLSHLPYGRALVNGHLHVANWVKDQGVDLYDYHNVVGELYNGPLESLQWLAANNCGTPFIFPTEKTVDLSVIAWLTQDVGNIPRDEVIVAAFRQLPESAERLLLYLALPAVKVRFEISVSGLLKACIHCAWHEVDFVAKYFPAVLKEAERQNPGIIFDIGQRVTEAFMEPFDRCNPGPVPRSPEYRRFTRPYCAWRKES